MVFKIESVYTRNIDLPKTGDIIQVDIDEYIVLSRDNTIVNAISNIDKERTMFLMNYYNDYFKII